MNCRTYSIWQPWASLVMLGLKPVETRPYGTSYRGRIYIHATKKTPAIDLAKALADENFVHYASLENLHNAARTIESWPHGSILGWVDLLDVMEAGDYCEACNKNEVLRYGDTEIQLSVEARERDWALGDLSYNRFAWILSEPVNFPYEIPASGSQSAWDCYDNLLAVYGKNFLEQTQETARIKATAAKKFDWFRGDFDPSAASKVGKKRVDFNHILTE